MDTLDTHFEEVGAEGEYCYNLYSYFAEKDELNY